MRSAHVTRPGGPELLAVVEVPTHGPGKVLIRVAAAGVNRRDVQQRCGLPHRPAPRRCPFAGTLKALDAEGG
jgi:NADPH:quinone reductase